jgi:hypothetical protein
LLTASAFIFMGVSQYSTDTSVMRYSPFVIGEKVYAMDVRTGKIFENSFAVKVLAWGRDPNIKGSDKSDNKWKNVCGMVNDRDPLDIAPWLKEDDKK